MLVAADGLERIQRGLFDDAGEVLDAQLAVDGLVEGAHRHGRAAVGRGMGVEHDRVARRHHADDVAGHRGDGMGATA